MDLQCQELGERTLVTVDADRLDAAVADEFKRRVIDLAEAGKQRIVLDLSPVKFIDSSGLGAVVGVFKFVERCGSLELACPSPPVQKVFNLTRMNRIFVIHESLPLT